MNRHRVLDVVNRTFDAAGHLGPGGRRSSFRVSGVVGLLVGLGLALVVTRLRGQSALVTLALTVAAVGCFLGLVVVRARREGAARLICLHDQLAALTGATVLLLLLRQPVLAYLDVVVLGMGMLVAGGRVGCLLVGCCHGRPAAWGPRYGEAHVREGFPEEFAGVRLLPVPLFEAVALVAFVAFGAWLAVNGAAAGTVLGWYVTSQLFVRFWLEYLRGDPRPTLGAVSEAQWTAAGVLAALALATATRGSALLSGLLFGCLGLVVLAIAVASRALRSGLTAPEHLREVLGVLRAAERYPDELVVATTHLGVRISAQCRSNRERHVAFSRSSRSLTWSEAVTIGRVARLAQPAGAAVMVGPSRDAGPAEGATGVYHLSVKPGEPAGERVP